MVIAQSPKYMVDPSENQISDLVQYSGSKIGRRFRWVAPTITIGSGPQADIVIPEPTISAIHAKLTRDPTGYYIEDMGSELGTFLLDIRIDGKKRFIDGDILTLGNIIVKFFACGRLD